MYLTNTDKYPVGVSEWNLATDFWDTLTVY